MNDYLGHIFQLIGRTASVNAAGPGDPASKAVLVENKDGGLGEQFLDTALIVLDLSEKIQNLQNFIETESNSVNTFSFIFSLP